MTVKELIKLLRSIPYENADVKIGYDSNLGKTSPNGSYKITKYEDGSVDVFLKSDS